MLIYSYWGLHSIQISKNNIDWDIELKNKQAESL